MIRICPHCGQKNRVPIARLPETGACGRCKQPLPPIAEPIAADPALFDEALRDSKLPILVDFWAAWCGPCKMAKPEVARVAKEMAGRALVLEVDTENQPELARRYNVQSIPYFVVIRGGQTAFQQAGVVRAAELKRWIEQYGAPTPAAAT